MLSLQVLYFILLWVCPGILMVLLKYDTPKFNRLTKFIPIFLVVCMPVIGPLYYSEPLQRLIILYSYMFLILSYTLATFHQFNLVKAVSIGGLICVLSSYLWELPWLFKNAVVVGWEPDWVLHLMGLFYFWYMKDTIGFKKGYPTKLMIALFLGISTWYMFYTGIGPNVYDAVVWNANNFMYIRIISIFVVFQSLVLPIREMNTIEDKK